MLLSGYANPLYDELYDGWHRLDVPVPRPSANHADRDRHAVEVIWSNRPLRGMADLFTDPARDETLALPTECDETARVRGVRRTGRPRVNGPAPRLLLALLPGPGLPRPQGADRRE